MSFLTAKFAHESVVNRNHIECLRSTATVNLIDMA